MWNKRKLLVGAALVLVSGSAVAQRSFSVVAGGQMYLTKARFVEAKPAGFGLGLVPHLYSGFMVGAAVGLSPRYAVQATVGVDAYGVSFQAHRGSAMRFSQYATEYALVLRRQYATGQTGHVWFTDSGFDMLHAGGGGITSFGIESSNMVGPGTSVSGTIINGKSYRVGVRLGVGREWALSSRHHVALQAIASIGLSDLRRYRLQNTTWQQGQTIDPIVKDVLIATRASFVGVQVRYRFQL